MDTTAKQAAIDVINKQSYGQGFAILSSLTDAELCALGKELLADGYQYALRPRYSAVPGSTLDIAIRAVRRAFDLAIA